MGLTQSELAKKLGTTAATVSRLETDGIKISVDWLEPLATIFQIPLTDLLDAPSTSAIPVLGTIGEAGTLLPSPESSGNTVSISVPAPHPIAVRLDRNTGPYLEGEILIGNKLDAAPFVQAHHRICLICTHADEIVLAHLVPDSRKPPGYTLVPLQTACEARHVRHVSWCAPIVMAVRFF